MALTRTSGAVSFADVAEKSDVGVSPFSEDMYRLQMSSDHFMLDKGHQFTENGTTLGLHGENTFCLSSCKEDRSLSLQAILKDFFTYCFFVFCLFEDLLVRTLPFL